MAILCAGKVVFEGDTEALLKIAKGKIYTASVLQDELENFKNHYSIISIHQNGKDVSCRFFSDEKQQKSWSVCETTIEDSYMYLLSEHKAGEGK